MLWSGCGSSHRESSSWNPQDGRTVMSPACPGQKEWCCTHPSFFLPAEMDSFSGGRCKGLKWWTTDPQTVWFPAVYHPACLGWEVTSPTMRTIAVVILGGHLKAINGEDLFFLTLCLQDFWPPLKAAHQKMILSFSVLFLPAISHVSCFNTCTHTLTEILIDDSKRCDGDVSDSQGMSALQAEKDKGRGKKEKEGAEERAVSLLVSSPNNNLLALLCVYAEPAHSYHAGLEL